ncbi:MAG: hydroxyacid dehydrogenase [Chloroflexi bacterium]|nr:hydroxyacid dehydrogenase [Chloroflexota bacterium]
MPLSAHLAYDYSDTVLSLLRAQLDPTISLTVGSSIPDGANYHILINGRPRPEQLEISPNLHSLIIPWAGLPTGTRDLMQGYPHIAVYNLHHNAVPVAETVLMLLMAAAKRIIPADRNLRQGDWTIRYVGPEHPDKGVLLAGKTALILGFGAIGQRVAALLQALDMRVMVTRRSLSEATQVGGIDQYPADSLHDLLPQAQALIVTLPLTPLTEGLIAAEELALLPQDAIVINIGRGPIIDEQALHDALATGQIYGAGIDVWYNYPPDEAARGATLPSTAPFHNLDNIVMNPHRGGSSMDTDRLRMAHLADLLNTLSRTGSAASRVDLSRGY